MPEPPGESARTSPLAPLRDIFVAPTRAYAEIAERPIWIPAFCVVVAASALDLTLAAPAVTHLSAVLAAHAHVGAASSTSAADVAASTKANIANNLIVDAFGPLLDWSLTAMVLATVARWKNQTTPFATFFALCAVCALPGALGSVVDGIGTAIRDPATIDSWKALVGAVPDNLGIFAAVKNDREVAFLSNFGIFGIWSTLLLAFGFAALAQVRVATALIVTFGLDVVLALCYTLLFAAS